MPNDLVNIPEAVRDRLADVGAVSCLHQRSDLVEARFQPVELRAADDGTVGLVGYASVTESAYDVAGGPPFGWSETIARGAFAKTLAERDDVRLLINHEGLPLARTASGTMLLSEDSMGLLVEVNSLDPANPRVAELRSAMEREDVDQMSFAFRVMRQEWDEDYINRRIAEVKLFDVSVVTFPANPATVVGLRSDDDVSDPAEPSAAFPLALARAQVEALRMRRHVPTC
jgi:hypothetical protein